MSIRLHEILDTPHSRVARLVRLLANGDLLEPHARLRLLIADILGPPVDGEIIPPYPRICALQQGRLKRRVPADAKRVDNELGRPVGRQRRARRLALIPRHAADDFPAVTEGSHTLQIVRAEEARPRKVPDVVRVDVSVREGPFARGFAHGFAVGDGLLPQLLGVGEFSMQVRVHAEEVWRRGCNVDDGRLAWGVKRSGREEYQ